MARLGAECEEPVRALVRGQLVVSLLRIVRESVAPQNRLDRLGQGGRLLSSLHLSGCSEASQAQSAHSQEHCVGEIMRDLEIRNQLHAYV